MAQAYTPGLTVTGRTRVEKIRRLPLKGEVLAREGQEVEADTVVARTFLPGSVYPMNAASILNVEPGELKGRMIKHEGDPLEKGERIALSRGFFGLFQTPLLSPVTGVIESVSEATGQIILREPPVPVEVNGYVAGRVKKVIPEEGVVVETSAAFIQGIFGIGGEAQGIIKMKASEPSDTLAEGDVLVEDKGMILVAGSFIEAAAFHKAEELGVAGVIAGGVRYGDLKEILGYEIGVAITGAESLRTSLVVTEGFGTIPMSKRTFDLIQRFDGWSASINGATQIRAGVIRPELVIPLAERGEEGEMGAPMEEAVLDVGAWVRIIRAPHFGIVGRVVELPAEARRMDSETFARVVGIRSEAGEYLELPRANVEIIVQ